jgi:hypothetical protein
MCEFLAINLGLSIVLCVDGKNVRVGGDLPAPSVTGKVKLSLC